MPNLLAQPRHWKKKAIFGKEETNYGVDAAPTGLLNWLEAREVSFTSGDAETQDRNIEMPYMGNGGKVITSMWSKLGFKVAVAPSGSLGVAPKWGYRLLGCGFAETVSAGASVTYNLVSNGFDSITDHMNIDGTLYKFLGSRGDLKFSISAKGLPWFTFEYTSLYTLPVEGAMPAVDRSGWTLEEAVNSVNTGKLTINGVDLAFSVFEGGVGNKISRIDLPGPQLEVGISERAPTCNATVLAPALSAFDPYTLQRNATPVVVSNTHGSGPGKRLKTDVKGVIIGVAEDQIEGMLAYKLTIEPKPVDGNDEITFTLL